MRQRRGIFRWVAASAAVAAVLAAATVAAAQPGCRLARPGRVRGWNAVTGYDLSSGLGAINAGVFVPGLAALAWK